MKDKLEEFIAENRESFDQFEPNEEIWNSVKSNINKGRRKRKIAIMA